MAAVHYEEVQRFTSLKWLWVAILLFMLSPLMMASSELEEQRLRMLLLTALFGTLPVLILFFSRLELRVDAFGIHYRFFPSVWKWKLIQKDNISNIEVTEPKNLLERITCGYRRNLFKNTTVMNITGKKFLRITLNNGQKFKIGSENPEEIERVLKRLFREVDQ